LDGAEDAAIVRRLVVAPGEAAGVGAARRLLPLGLGREALAAKGAVGARAVPGDGAHGLPGPAEGRVRPEPVPPGAARVGGRADAGGHALAPGLVRDLGEVEVVRGEVDDV